MFHPHPTHTGLYRGTAITLLRDVPSYGVYFALYEHLRGALDARVVHTTGALSGHTAALHQFVAGGVAGVVSWFTVYPFDVVKSRLQATCWQHSPYAGAGREGG